MKIAVAIPIWGSGYVDRFLGYTLPTLLAPRNLPALDLGAVLLYTTEEDAARLRESLHAFDARVKINVVAPSVGHPPFAGGHNGTLMRNFFQRGFDYAWGNDMAFAPVCADAVYSDEFFNSANVVLKSGKRAAVTQGSGVNVEVIRPFLEANKRDGIVAVHPRVMIREFMRCVRYGLDLPRWPGTRLYPAQMFWPVENHGAIMRCCHMYPVLLKPERYYRMAYSPDNDLVENTLSNLDQIGWLRDSDQGFFFGLAEPGHASIQEAKPAGDTSLENFCRSWMSPWKAEYFKEVIVWHDGRGEDWSEARAASDLVVDHILGVYRSVTRSAA